ncbi:MAG: hypothetical protein ACI8PQ_000438 [Planctomycetota bacterium]|jgi:hypothetical protein
MFVHETSSRLPSGLRLAAKARAAAIALPLALILPACGGGGGGGNSISVGFDAGTSSSSEGVTASVVVVLRTGGGVLKDEVSVVISDAGTGSAVSGSDYTAIAPLTITFAEGSADLDTVSLLVPLLNDSTVEGADESIDLFLDDVSEGASIRKGGVHALTVMETNIATIQFSSSSTTTPDEGDATYMNTVVLSLDSGDVLGVDASVVVSDGGNGTATSGSDYDAFSNQAVLFSAGTSNGTSVDISLTVRDDTDAESHETLILELVSASGGVSLGTNDVYTLTITEDDANPDPFLIPLTDDIPGGSLVVTASGDDRDFGIQTIGAGPQDVVRVELTNAGLQEMSLSAMAMSGDTRDFRIETQLGSLPPGIGQRRDGLNSNLVAPMPIGSMALGSPAGIAFTYDSELASAFVDESSLILDGFVTPDGEVLSLALGKRPLPIASDAQLFIDGVAQPGGFETALVGVSVWSGTVLDTEGSEVFLALSPGGMQGWVRFGEDHDFETLHLLPAQDGALVVIAEDSELSALSTTGGPVPCAGSLLPENRIVAPGMSGDPDVSNVGVGVALASARLAIETDFHLYSLFGDAGDLTVYVTQLVAALADGYERDVQSTFEIAYLGVYTTAGDPWSSGDSSGDDTIDLLNEFRAAWNSSGWPATADLAHFISGANLGGGVAYVGVLCNQVFGYGVSANINGSINWGTFDGSPGSFTWDYVVVAHELGHNFGASHTHEYCPPLDECATNCNGVTSCVRSTIMSYCHTCGSGLSNIELRFHPYNADVIRDEIAGSCLGDAVLAPGASVTFDVAFDPVSSSGAKDATISFTHGGINEPSPFRLDYSGTSQN